MFVFFMVIFMSLFMLFIQGVCEFLPISSSTFLKMFNSSMNNLGVMHLSSGIGGVIYYWPQMKVLHKDRFFLLFVPFFVLYGLFFILFDLTNYRINTYIINIIFGVLLLIRMFYNPVQNKQLNIYYAPILAIIPVITMLLSTSRLDGLLQFFLTFFSLDKAFDYACITTTIVNLSGFYYLFKIKFNSSIEILSTLILFILNAVIGYFALNILRKRLRLYIIISLIFRISILLLVVLLSYLEYLLKPVY